MKNRNWSIVNSQWWKRVFFSKLLFTIIFGLSTFFCFSGTPILIQTIPKKPISIFINTTNDIFFIQKGMLNRYTSAGQFFQNYGSIYINNETEIISINGFKTILFSPDFGKIIELDNRLKEIDVVDITLNNEYLITCVGVAYDNNYLWLWDMAAQKIIKYSKKQETTFKSNSISLLLGKQINPKQIIEAGIFLYLVDEKNGIFIFDNQGNYIKNIPIDGIQHLTVIENTLFYTKENYLYKYDAISFSEIRFSETPNLKAIKLGKSLLCGINKKGFIEIWKY